MVELTEANVLKLFYENNGFIINHLLTLSPMAVAVIDQANIIRYHNNYFLKLTPQNSELIGKSITRYIESDFIHQLTQTDQNSSIRITFNFIEASMPFEGLFLKSDDLYLMVAYPCHLAETELIMSLSTLTHELTNLTRDLNRKNIALEQANKTITQLMHTDPLTGLVNRRELDEALGREISKSIRHNLPLSAIMVDLDYFKKVNDTYGHEAGDEVLVKVAETILNTVRKEDIAARFGGEEFIVILPNTPLDSSINLANRIRVAIEKLNFTSVATSITASFGVTEYKAKETHHHFIDRADKALYEAKETGRNRVAYHA